MSKNKHNTDKDRMEKYRQEVAKRYKDTFEELKSENRKLMLENAELKSKYIDMERTIDRLESINSELQECIGLNDEELKVLVESRKSSLTMRKSMESMSRILGGSGFW